MADTERGAALVLAILVAGLLSALGGSLLVVADAERRMAANTSYGVETLAAADAGVERVILDLSRAASWNGILSGGESSAFADGSRRPGLPAGGTVDLDAATLALQAESSAQAAFGANTPVWRLFAWGPISRMTGGVAADSRQYVAVWVADDPGDMDGNPSVDSNGFMTVHAEAFGLGGAHRVVEATVARVTAGIVKQVSWREVR